MRFMKNSSRLEPITDRKNSRSSSGLRTSQASLNTRRLNSSQVSSRFRYHSGAVRSNTRSVLPALSFLSPPLPLPSWRPFLSASALSSIAAMGAPPGWDE